MPKLPACYLLLSAQIVFSYSIPNNGIGKFFHITDFHLDLNYSQYGDPNNFCHANGTGRPDIGPFGNYSCDTPPSLLEATLAGMRKVLPNPDFIIWTGDTVPHLLNSMYDTQSALVPIENVTNALNQNFPGIKTYPTLGNHDYWPSGDLPPHLNPIYQTSKKLWEPWIGNQYSMANYAYYSLNLTSTVTLIAMNTNYYTSYNAAVNSSNSDPGNQFYWLENQLRNVKIQGRKALIITHIAPGFYGRSIGGKLNVNQDRQILPQYNRRFSAILKKYASSIVTLLAGHTHRDAFRVYSANGSPKMTLLLAPAIDPWVYPPVGGNNPGFRIIDYNRSTFQLIDIHQYWLDLPAANMQKKAVWQLEYSFSTAYGTTKIDPPNLAMVIGKLKVNDTLFQENVMYNSVQWNRGKVGKCVGNCKIAQMCAMQFLEEQNYANCVNGGQMSSTGGTLTSPSSGSKLIAANLCGIITAATSLIMVKVFS